MLNKVAIAVLALLVSLVLPPAARAETVVGKVSRTGVLTFGTPINVIPYAYVNDQEKLVGYSVDVLELIRQELQKDLGRSVTVDFQAINNTDVLIQQVAKGNIDIACSTQFTWERQEFVDFSIPYSLSGVRLLTKSGSPLTGTAESLVGKKVGVVLNTMGEVVMKRLQPKAIRVPLKDPEDGFAQLQSGTLDAIAGDSIVLAGTTLKSKPESYALVPLKPYARYGIACMVPQNNSAFLNAVNRAIARLMQGYIIGDKKSVEIVNQWLGPNGLVEIPEELLRAYFETIILSHEQIRLSDPPQTQGQAR
jgi:polar amino acid transport system substrate-binding protein